MNTLVRVCAATYDKTPVEQEGIRVLVGDKLHLLVSEAGRICSQSHESELQSVQNGKRQFFHISIGDIFKSMSESRPR